MRAKSLLFMLLATATVASCSKQASDDVDLSKGITINPSINSMSRVANNAFVNGDAISIYGYTTGAPTGAMIIDNVVATLGNGVWSPASQMMWKDKTTRHDFLAIYPVTAIKPGTPHSLEMQNSIAENDILVATATNLLASNTGLNLPFDHIMSKVTVNLTFNDEFDGTPVVDKVVFKSMKTVSINYPTKVVTASGDIKTTDLVAVGANPLARECVVAPQRLLTGQSTIDIFVGGDEVPYKYTLSGPFNLNKGENHTFNLTVGGKKQIELTGNITIGGWGNGATSNGGATH